jgi:hypothetical protein
MVRTHRCARFTPPSWMAILKRNPPAAAAASELNVGPPRLVALLCRVGPAALDDVYPWPGWCASDVQVGVGTTHAGEPLYNPARRRPDVVVTFGVGAGTRPIGSVAF